MWLAAPSSPNAGGTGAWTAKHRVREGDPQLRQRRGPFVAAVRHRPQIGDGQVAFAVGGVGRGRDRRRIGRPHRGCATWRWRRAPARPRRSSCQLGQPRRLGRGCGRNMPWASPSARLARILSRPCSAAARGSDTCAGVARRGEIAEAQPRIIVARPDDPVEVDLAQRHQRGGHLDLVAGLDLEQLGRFAVDHDRLSSAAS